MKKSEMVIKISGIIERVFTVQNIDSLSQSELAEEFLYELEKVGMNPPPFDSKFLDINGDYLEIYEWEKEDEE